MNSNFDSLVIRSTSPQVEYAPLIDQAKSATKGKLGVNQVVTVSTEGGLNHPTALYVCAPEKNEESLKQCYKNIFNKAASKQATTVLIPSFSTRPGCFNPDVAAQIAVDEARAFVKTNKSMKIHFVMYCSKDEERRDAINAASYEKAMVGCDEQMANVRVREGEIQNLIGDLIVIPVGQDYKNPGAVSQAVETTVFERRKLYQQPDSDPMPALSIVPLDVSDFILKHCDIRSLGRAASTSKLFKKFVQSNSLWQAIAIREVPEQYKSIKQPLIENFDFKTFVEENTGWILSDENRRCLDFMKANPRIRAGAYLPEEFSQAYELIKKGTPEAFKSMEHHGQGTHQLERTNAIDFLNDCLEENSAFRKIIATYQELDAEVLKCETDTMPAKELGDKLSALLNRTKAML